MIKFKMHSMIALLVFLLYFAGFGGIMELEAITNEGGMPNLPKDKSKDERDQESILMKNQFQEQEIQNRFNL